MAKKVSMSADERLAAALVPEEEWPYEIPENWCWTKLSSALIASKERTEEFNDPQLKYVGLEHMQSDVGIVSFGSPESIKSLKSVFKAGQLLYGKLRPYLNKHDIASFDGVCSTDILVFDPMPTVSAGLMNYYFNLDFFIQYVVANSKGINLPRVSESIVLDAFLPLPPLSEQHRIVDCIDSMFAKLDETADEAQAVIDGYENRKAAILHRAFTGELTEEWRLKSHISDECWHTQLFSSIIVSGPQNGLYKSKDSYGQGYRILRVDGFYDGWIEPWDTLKRLSLTQEELKLYQLNIGDIIVNRVNSMPYLGKSALIRELPEPCVFESNMMRIVINIDQAVPEYITRYLNSPLGLSELRKNAKQAINQASINQKDVGNVLIPLPPLPEQHEIVRRLDTLLAAEAATKAAAEATLENITTLRQSILARAFRGELGTNDPEDEPAIELLKRTLLAN